MYYLSKLIKSEKYLFIFIQEHWLSVYEANSKFSSDFSAYEFLTTSSDTFSTPEEILSISGPIWHGTALGWHSSFSSSIKPLPIISTRFCGIRMTSPLHILAYTVYLPTSGQDEDYLEELSKLAHDISEHNNTDTVIIIGLDSNTSEKSTKRRQTAFDDFKNEFCLESILQGDEPTFHHNNGTSESQIDHLLTNNKDLVFFSKHLCKNIDSENLSSHDAIQGKIKIDANKEIVEKNYSDTYEAFEPKKIIWRENEDYQNMTECILDQLLVTFDKPEHLPALAEMSSRMIALCAEKCFETKKSKGPRKNNTPRFSKELNDAYHMHRQVCKEWRKAGRPTSSEHPAKLSKLQSQRKIQKISREEEATKARGNHDDLMATHDKNITDVCIKIKKIVGENSKPVNIPEIETFLGKYKGDNVLEGFRANTEHLCNVKTSKTFSNEFLNRCEEVYWQQSLPS